VILFNSASVEMTSPAFYVREGRAVLLTAFGLAMSMTSGAPDAQRAVIEKVRYEDGVMPHGDACESMQPPESTVLQAEDVTQCGVWSLSPCFNTRVLSVPGAYRLVLTDKDALGAVYIEAVDISADAARLIPDELFFGADVGECC
jgi:hypothetical protein